MKDVYKSYMMEQLQNLISIDSPTGFTGGVQKYLAEEITRLGYTPECLHKGGVRADLGGEGNGLMLFAHCDTLGAIVRDIQDNGRLTVSRIGGLNPNNVETEHVKVYTRFGGVYEGTFQVPNASSHVNAHVNNARSFEENLEIVLDEIVKNGDDVRALGIDRGDFVAVNPRFTVTSKGYIKSRVLDDKACAAVLLTLAKQVKDENIALKRSVWISFTVYEEIGHGGSVGIPEDVCEVMSVDMGCVGDGMTCTEREVAICAKDGGGPYNYECTTALLKTAIDNNIPHAIDVYHNYSSDVDVTLRSGYDIKHCLIGPGVYASHGYERTHMDGLTATFDLLTAYLK